MQGRIGLGALDDLLIRGARQAGAVIAEEGVQGGVVAAVDDEKGIGAGLRISGANRTNTLSGNSKWQPLEFKFTIEEETREVELVAELRTTRGQAWFDVESLRLSRKPPAAEEN